MLRLQAFPVQYPANHWAINRGIQDLNRPRWSLEIFFRNSYKDPRNGALHHAIDIMGAVGLTVVSATDGVIAPYYFAHRPPASPLRPVRDGIARFYGADYTPGGGNVVLIVDDFGYLHYYAHLYLRAVTPGTQELRRISAGTVIGYLGKTGSQAAGSPSHLHYQVIKPAEDGGPYGVRVPHRREPVSTAELPKRTENQYDQLRALAEANHAIEGARRDADDVILLIPFDDPHRTVSGYPLVDLLARRQQVLNPRDDPSTPPSPMMSCQCHPGK